MILLFAKFESINCRIFHETYLRDNREGAGVLNVNYINYSYLSS